MDIISDKHWLIENVICLLSNAVKYSNGGVVKILVEHVQSVKHDVQDEETKNENENMASATNDPRGTGMKPITLPSLQLLHTSHHIACCHISINGSFTISRTPFLDCKEYVKISVEDSGIGVPLPSRCDLFQVIDYTTHRALHYIMYIVCSVHHRCDVMR